jgi:hypothetical protein
MAVERKDPGAGRPLRTPPTAASPIRPRPAVRPVPPRPPTRPRARGGGWRSALAWSPGPPVLRLVLGPALLTLAVTLLRLVGELRGWSPAYFSRLPGGGLSPLGITWIAPLAGLYFGWRLQRARVRAPSAIRAGFVPASAAALGALAALIAGKSLQTSWTANFTLWAVVSVAVAVVAFAAWPTLGRPLLLYAWAARLPVVLVMALAVWKGWGTHYDVPPPGFPAMPPLKRWLWIGLLPQTTIWVAWTMVTGTLAGALGWWIASRRPR